MRCFARPPRLIPAPKIMLGLVCACLLSIPAAATETPADNGADALTQFLTDRGLAMPWGVDAQKALSLSAQLSLNAMGLIGVPESFTCSLFSRHIRISSKNCSTNSLASRLFNPRRSCSRSANSDLVSAVISLFSAAAWHPVFPAKRQSLEPVIR